MGRGPASTGIDRRRAIAVLVILLAVLAAGGCRSWGRGRDHEPLSPAELDDLYLRMAVDQLIYEALTKSDPEALRWFFHPAVRNQVDCDARYRQLMGASAGVYQPRFRDMKTLEITYDERRQRARTKVMLECVDRRPGSRGAGTFIPLELAWIKLADKWYLEPPAEAAGDQTPAPPAADLVPR